MPSRSPPKQCHRIMASLGPPPSHGHRDPPAMRISYCLNSRPEVVGDSTNARGPQPTRYRGKVHLRGVFGEFIFVGARPLRRSLKASCFWLRRSTSFSSKFTSPLRSTANSSMTLRRADLWSERRACAFWDRREQARAIWLERWDTKLFARGMTWRT